MSYPCRVCLLWRRNASSTKASRTCRAGHALALGERLARAARVEFALARPRSTRSSTEHHRHTELRVCFGYLLVRHRCGALATTQRGDARAVAASILAIAGTVST